MVSSVDVGGDICPDSVTHMGWAISVRKSGGYKDPLSHVTIFRLKDKNHLKAVHVKYVNFANRIKGF